MTTDTFRKEAVCAARGIHGRRHEQGLGDDPPRARDDARGAHDRLSARTGEAASTSSRPAVEPSFNAISVDGEPSTNDCVILLANGASGVERTAETDAQFAAALLARSAPTLARQVVADGEG